LRWLKLWFYNSFNYLLFLQGDFIPVCWIESPEIQQFQCLRLDRSLLRSIFISYRNARSITYSRNPTILVFEARSIGIEEYLYILLELSIDYLIRENQRFQCLRFDRSLLRSIFISCGNDRSIPASRNPTISVFEVRSIGIEEYFYILLE
jgi:hypothetical protein